MSILGTSGHLRVLSYGKVTRLLVRVQFTQRYLGVSPRPYKLRLLVGLVLWPRGFS